MSKIPFIKAKHAQMKLIEGGGGGTNLELLSIYVDTPPEKVEYFVGDTFTLSGLKVIATYSEDYYKDVTNNVTCSISEGHVFVADEEGAEDVVLTYTQDGVTQRTSFGIAIRSGKVVNYSFSLGSNRTTQYSNEATLSHVICVGNASIVKLTGVFTYKRNSGSGTKTAYCRIKAIWSSNRFVSPQTIVKEIKTYALSASSTTTYTSQIDVEIDIKQVFSGYEDKENCYILAYLETPPDSSRVVDVTVNCELKTVDTDLKVLTKLENVFVNTEYSFVTIPSQQSIVAKKYIIDVAQLGIGQSIVRGAYKVGTTSMSVVETVDYNSVKTTEREIPLLTDQYDLTRPYELRHRGRVAGYSQTRGTTIFELEIQ